MNGLRLGKSKVPKKESVTHSLTSDSTSLSYQLTSHLAAIDRILMRPACSSVLNKLWFVRTKMNYEECQLARWWLADVALDCWNVTKELSIVTKVALRHN